MIFRRSYHPLVALATLVVGLGMLSSQEPAKTTTSASTWDEIQGEWQILKARKGNKEADPEQVAQTKMVVAKESLQIVEPFHTETVKIVSVKPGQGLSQVDMAVEREKGKVLEGIFTRQGDKLLFAWSKTPEKGKRPANFETRGDSIVFMELARPKKDAKKVVPEETPKAPPERKAPGNPNS